VARSNALLQRHNPLDFFYGKSLLHRGVIFACLPDFYLFKLADFKATASRHLKHIFKQPLSLLK